MRLALLFGTACVVAVPALHAAAAATTAAHAAAHGRSIELGGRLVAALAPRAPGRERELFLLVRPTDEVDGPRRLLHLRGDGSAMTVIAEEVGGWSKALAAVDLGGGAQLLVGGLGRVDSYGPLETPDASGRTLLDHPGLDLRSLAPARLRVGTDRQIAAAEVGRLRIWIGGEAGGPVEGGSVELPFDVRSERGGLVLRGPPVTALPPDAAGRRRFAVGPEAIGSRLRVVLASEGEEGAWSVEEAWASLPGAEAVEESWVALVDGAPGLIVHTQGALEMNAFEEQRWRAFRLASDRTRAGHGPGLAISVDSKRWHDDDALFADVDGDGRDDLVIARPEGMSGTDLVVQVHRGQGGGTFERRARRSDVDRAPSAFELLADVDGAGRPGLVGVYDDRVALWRLARRGGHALEEPPFAILAWDRGAEKPVPAEAEASRWTDIEWLGSVERRGAPPLLLLLATPEKGSAQLVVLATDPP